MFGTDPAFEALLMDDSACLLRNFLASFGRLHGVAALIAVLAVLTSAQPLRAQQEILTLGASRNFPFASNTWQAYFGEPYLELVDASDTSPDRLFMEQPGSDDGSSSWADSFGIEHYVARRGEWYGDWPSPFAAQSQAATPVGLSDAPPLPPPMDPTTTEQNGPALPSEPKEDGGIVTEVPDEPPKKDEKPAIPDLAKGILILSNEGDLTFKPGVRIQPKYIYESGNDNHDFLIRRFRLKGGGNAFDIAKYGVELKIDNDGRFAATPSARVENAWLDFIAVEDLAYLRVGLYDMPFSRNALTSDSKLLLMDRSLIKEAVTDVGMADNSIGLMLHGRPYCGQFEYAVGLFDSVVFERFGVAGTRESDHLMPAGRLVWSLLDPMPALDGYADYLESYLGKGERLELGINAAHLGEVIDGAAVFDLTAWGVDLFYNTGPYTFQTEYDQIFENIALAADLIAEGWYVQGGYLLNPCDPCIEFAVRYQELDPLVGDRLTWTSVGFNYYIREHNLKVQTDYTIRSDTVGTVLPGGLGLFDEDVFQVQLQLEF
ncbi:MAG: porin [Pirellulales bacterium]